MSPAPQFDISPIRRRGRARVGMRFPGHRRSLWSSPPTTARRPFDRLSLSLPGDQNALISAVAAANPCTVVVLNTGGRRLRRAPGQQLPDGAHCACLDLMVDAFEREVPPGAMPPRTASPV
jgi:hypothetical protein